MDAPSRHPTGHRRNTPAFCLAIAVIAMACPAEAAAGGRGSPGPSDLPEQANAALGLRASRVIRLSFDARPGKPLAVVLPAEAAPNVLGRLGYLDLEPHSTRAADYQVLVQQPDGSFALAEPGPVRTMRGTVRGVPGSAVAATIHDGGLHARMLLPNGQEYWIEPLWPHVEGAGEGRHVVYSGDDVLETDKGCGALADEMPDDPLLGGAAAGAGDDVSGGSGGGEPENPPAGCAFAELAVDVDYEFFQMYGTVAAVEDRVNSVINAVNVQYERDVAITHAITMIIVRTAEPDPYTTTDAAALAQQMRTQWLNNHGDVQRDVAQLFTGKNLDGNIIGWAWFNGVCSPYTGYSVVQSSWTSNFAGVTDLSAHELGHNWGADHCSCTNPPYTMNPYITGANEFGPATIPVIETFRDSRSCLEYDPTGATPPAAPSGLTAVAISPGIVELAWTDNADNEDGFRIECSANGAGWTLIDSVGSNVTGYSHTGLAPATTYSYRVLAYNGDGESPYSNVAGTTTPGLPLPAAPSGLAASAASSSAIDLTWLDNSGDEDGFRIECSSNGTSWTPIDSVSANVASYEHTGLAPATTYSYRVLAYNANGESPYSNVASATTQSPPSQVVIAPLAGFAVEQGNPLGGGLADLHDSDDSYARIGAALQGRSYKAAAIITATSPHTSVSSLELTIETGADAAGVKTTVYLLRLNNNKWTKLEAFSQPLSDTTRTYAGLSNPNVFVDGGSGQIRVKIVCEARSNQAPDGFAARLDHVRLEVTP